MCVLPGASSGSPSLFLASALLGRAAGFAVNGVYWTGDLGGAAPAPHFQPGSIKLVLSSIPSHQRVVISLDEPLSIFAVICLMVRYVQA